MRAKDLPIINPDDAGEHWVRVEDGRPIEEDYEGGRRSPWLLGVSQFIFREHGIPAILRVQRTDLAPHDRDAPPIWVLADADRKVVHGITHWRYRVRLPSVLNTYRSRYRYDPPRYNQPERPTNEDS